MTMIISINRCSSARIPISFGAIIGLALFCATSLWGQDNVGDGSAAPQFADSIALHAFVSTSWSYNFNRPSSKSNELRIFDFDDNSFKLDVAEVVLQKPAEQPTSVGFRIDATVGASVPRVTASRGFFRDAGGTAGDIDLQQVYLSYVAAIGTGLHIDAGKFVTYAGYELIDGYDGFNDNATRSFLFGYAIPFTHTGLRLGYTASPEITISAMVANGWDNVADNNRAKSFGTQFTLTPAEHFTLLVAYIGGAERDTNSSDVRHLVDVVLQWRLGDAFTVGINADYCIEQNAVAPGKNALWQGLAGYLKLIASNRFSVALRGEVFEDRDGVRTGTPQTLKEVTLSPEFRPSPNVAFRADLRMDFSTSKVFDNDGTPTDTQPTFILNGLCFF